MERAHCVDASMGFICSWYMSRWSAMRNFSVVFAGSPGLYDHYYFDRISVVDLPPLAGQIESCLLDFAKDMNLTWTPYEDDTFEPDFKAQASAFFA